MIGAREVAARLGITGPALLNAVNNLVPGDRDAVRRARGIAYGPDPRQRLDVWAPRRLTGASPVLVFFYGGGWVAGRRDDYAFAARAYAAQGFVVVLPDYRLVPQVVFPAFVEDGAAAISWTVGRIADFGGDPQRLLLAGHSAGAYKAVLLALDPSYLQAAGVDAEVIRGAAGLSGPYDFHPFTGRAVAAMAGVADPMTTQPIRFARGDAPPLWLGHGTADEVVRARNSIVLAERVSELGGRVSLRLYDGLSHEAPVMALSKPFRSKAPVLADSAAFLHSVAA